MQIKIKFFCESRYQMNSGLAQDVRSFVAKERGMQLNKVRMDSRLEEDLGMTGDDAVEFLENFQKQFSVDLTDLEFHKHFGPEGFNPFWLLREPEWLVDHGKYPVTVEHLVRIAQAKQWICPPFVPKPNISRSTRLINFFVPFALVFFLTLLIRSCSAHP